jgi:hypothetical protein
MVAARGKIKEFTLAAGRIRQDSIPASRPCIMARSRRRWRSDGACPSSSKTELPMRRIAAPLALGLLAVLLMAQPSPAIGQTGEADRIDILYVEPESEELRPAYVALRKRAVLEQLKIFLSPIRLPRRLLIKAEQCGALTRDYQPGGAVSICYEYVRRIEQAMPEGRGFLLGPGAFTGENKGSLGRESLTIGPIIMQSLQQSASALFDILDVPVWGNAKEAANRLAAYLMTQFGEEVAWRTLMGSAWFVAQTTMTGAATDFYYVRDPEARNFYNILCMAYASDPKTFGFLARNLDIPSDRSGSCIQDFRHVQEAFDQTILPHVDQILMQKVRATPWLSPPQ